MRKRSIEEIREGLIQGNKIYQYAKKDDIGISSQRRIELAERGQEPYAIVVTCSDSRLPVEHIFHVGLGEIFVIRNAGNVIGEFDLGSIEYGTVHLHIPLVIVLGHTGCGAVNAAIHGSAEGHINSIVEEISDAIGTCKEEVTCVKMNVEHSISRIKESTLVEELISKGELQIKGAIYHLKSGEVEWL